MKHLIGQESPQQLFEEPLFELQQIGIPTQSIAIRGHIPSVLPSANEPPEIPLGSPPIRQTEEDRPTIRDIIASGSERVVFASSICSQPHYNLTELNDVDWQTIRASEARALPLASENDIVVTAGSFDQDYLQWMRSLGLGPGEVIELGMTTAQGTSAHLLTQEKTREHLLNLLGEKQATLAPYYSGIEEIQAAKELDMTLFGCSAEISEKYFNKGRFKEMCTFLGIPMIEGLSCESSPQKLEEIVTRLLRSYPRILLRGTEGANGSSIASVDQRSDAPMVAQEICQTGAHEILIEPFLNVIASPNDQWIISQDGTLTHLGTSIQIFRDLKHHGNESGGYLKRTSHDYINGVSRKIVEKMREDGYCGIVGIDYIISDRDEIYPIENNPRFNGSTFAYGIIDRLQEKMSCMTPTETSTWKFHRALETPMSFRELKSRYGDLFLDGSSARGIFPFDCEMLPHTGKWTPIIIADDRYHLERIERELEVRGSQRI